MMMMMMMMIFNLTHKVGIMILGKNNLNAPGSDEMQIFESSKLKINKK
jgi:hypothetical protein